MLDKRSKRVLWVFGIALLGILITELVRPKPIDWRASYISSDKIPLGNFVLFEEAPTLFKNAEIEKVIKDPYEFLVDSTYAQNSAYIFINDEILFDERQADEILKYVENGNTVFVSSRSFGSILADSLQIYGATVYNILEEEIHPKFFSPSLKQDSLPSFKKGVFKASFIEIDTLKTTALGYYESESPKLEEINYIKVNYGKGKFLLHYLPETFSNYYLLKGNEQYAANVFSYIDADKIYWDEYLKSGRKVVTSPMRFILDQAPLTWAYYVLLGGLLIFVLFKGKREQRIVEVMEPLENTSVEFTKTIGDLYFQHKDYSNIIAKKITYFMETLRSKYFLNTNDITEDFIKKLALKSGNTFEKTQKLMHLIKHLKEKSVHSEADLLELNKQIEAFRL
ncbi:DUF4350 domain-containing protein [Aequorivita antarctica]|uniref:DUF4350 domain-containing protein n=1 Tax=Aequorivita antarctica TaxID=153266 RepID=A0A5C6YVR7_9FLAO|nr:DUF4350 domain-containing protein [Aequorivita antarctica]TXD71712.1 DUF4350 domain-containing protein [Aequorivita antarctica]SRX75820.1 hypothetical protein AEQU3_02817 [Aequorivita antarctica]